MLHSRASLDFLESVSTALGIEILTVVLGNIKPFIEARDDEGMAICTGKLVWYDGGNTNITGLYCEQISPLQARFLILGMEFPRNSLNAMQVKRTFFNIVSLDVEHTIVRFCIEVGRFTNKTIGEKRRY